MKNFPILLYRELMLVLLLSVCTPIIAVDNKSSNTDYSSRTFLSIPPILHSGTPEIISGFRADKVRQREDGWNGGIQFIIAGGKSRNTDSLARYFLPFGKTSIVVSEETSNLQPLIDVFAPHFRIFTVSDNYQSTISINPQESVVGGAIHGRYSFWCNEESGRGFWVDLLLPVTRVRNRMNLTEIPLTAESPVRTLTPNPGYPVYNNMIDALKQPAFKYAKIDDTADKMRHTSLSDLEIKFGYEWLDHEPCHLESYIGVLAPTSRQSSAEYLFEAVPGNNKHAGIIFGSAIGVQIYNNEECERSMRMEIANHSQYLFRKTQLRTFDLKDKPWSRYLEMYANIEQAQLAASTGDPHLSTPGVNLLTFESRVTPGFANTINTALVGEWRKFHGEIGYNFYARRGENIELRTGFAADAPSIKSAIGLGFTNPIRDITGNVFLENAVVDVQNVVLPVPVANYAQYALTNDDIDLASASAPAVIAHTLYAGLGYNWETCDYPLFVDFGGEFTFSKSSNAVMERWTLWGKFGVSL